MKWSQVKRNWPSVQAEVKRTWGKIDEIDLAMIHGERDSFTRVLARRYGYEPEDAQQKLDAFIDRLAPETKTRVRFTWLSRQLEKCWVHVHVKLRS